MNQYTVRMNNQLRFLYSIALHLVSSASKRRKVDSSLSGMGTYVTSDPKVIKLIPRLANKINNSQDTLSLTESELLALHRISQDFQGCFSALCDAEYSVILGCTQQEAAELIDNLQPAFEQTTEYQKMFSSL